MQYEKPDCPECGSRAIGTIEWVPGLCYQTLDDEGRHVQYDGETKMFWNGQTPEYVLLDEDNSKDRMTCGDHEWDSPVSYDE